MHLPTRRHAFTLIELLIVIAVVSILAAMLLPAVSKGRDHARSADCVSRMRQLAMAVWLYAEENSGTLPRESYHANGVELNFWSQLSNPSSKDVWYNAVPRELGLWPASDFAYPAARQDFYRRNIQFQCPAAAFPKDASTQPVAYFSLAMNSKLILTPRSTMHLGSVLKPSSTVLFLDNRVQSSEPKADPLQIDESLGQPSSFANRFSVRHRQQGNLAFVDGSVRPHSGSKVVTHGGAIMPQTEVIWTADPTIDPNFAF